MKVTSSAKSIYRKPHRSRRLFDACNNAEFTGTANRNRKMILNDKQDCIAHFAKILKQTAAWSKNNCGKISRRSTLRIRPHAPDPRIMMPVL
jgi:hypothetical protein